MTKTLLEALEDKIADLKDRMTSIEGRGTGGNMVWGYVVGAAGVIIGVITLIEVLMKTAPVVLAPLH